MTFDYSLPEVLRKQVEKPKPKVVIAVSIDSDIKDAIDKIASNANVSRSQIFELALTQLVSRAIKGEVKPEAKQDPKPATFPEIAERNMPKFKY